MKLKRKHIVAFWGYLKRWNCVWQICIQMHTKKMQTSLDSFSITLGPLLLPWMSYSEKFYFLASASTGWKQYRLQNGVAWYKKMLSQKARCVTTRTWIVTNSLEYKFKHKFELQVYDQFNKSNKTTQRHHLSEIFQREYQARTKQIIRNREQPKWSNTCAKLKWSSTCQIRQELSGVITCINR
jgi:hypothetical protein